MISFITDLQIGRSWRGGLAVFIFLLIFLSVYLPVVKQQDKSRALVLNARRQYREAVKLSRAYGMLQGEDENGKNVVLQEPLFSYVEKVTRNLKLNNRIDYVRPENRTEDDGKNVEAVHVAFKGITLKEFVDFLYYIEVKKREIYIKSISIKKDSKKNLNTQMTLQKIG